MVAPEAARLSFQEQMELAELPSDTQSNTAATRRFMGTRGAYLPGFLDYGPGVDMPRMHKAAFGGHVYAQSGLAVCRAWGKLEDQNGVKPSARLGLHVSCKRPGSDTHGARFDARHRQSTATSQPWASTTAHSCTTSRP